VIAKPERRKVATQKDLTAEQDEEEGEEENFRPDQVNEQDETQEEEANHEPQRGRTSNTCFEFGPAHPLFLTHTQRIRSKQFIPVLAGGPPPSFRYLDRPDRSFAEANETARKELQRAARYFLTLLSPWTLQGDPTELKEGELLPRHGTSWVNFTEFIRELDGGGNVLNQPTFLQDCYLSYILDVSRNLRDHPLNRKASVLFRSRSSDQWHSHHISPCKVVKYFYDFHGKRSTFTQPTPEPSQPEAKEKEETKEAEALAENLRSKAREDDSKTKDPQQLYLSRAAHDLTLLFTQSSSKQKQKEAGLRKMPIFNPEQGERIWERLKAREGRDKLTPNPEDPFLVKKKRPSSGELIQQIKEAGNPTTDQLAVLDLVARHAEKLALYASSASSSSTTIEPGPEQLFLLIHGGPGVGKTWTLHRMQEILREFDLGVLFCAFAGSAASLLPNAETINTLFHIPATQGNTMRPLKDTERLDLRKKFENQQFIVVDEVSMVSSSLLGKINQRLCEIDQTPGASFGKRNVILVGDFFQIKPVLSDPLYKDSVRDLDPAEDASLPRSTGTRLFKNFRLLELKQQVRAAEDQIQMKMLETLRDLSLPNPIPHSLILDLEKRVAKSPRIFLLGLFVSPRTLRG